MTLDDIEKLIQAATPGPWGKIPGCGQDEDEGDYVIGAVGPDHHFLAGDEWEHDDEPRPTGLLPEDEANRRAQADQEFIATMRTLAPKMLAVCRAAESLIKNAPVSDLVSGRINLEQLRLALAALETP